MSLEFDFTCPLIDNGIDEIKNALDCIIDDLNPVLANNITQDKKNEIINSLYDYYFDSIIEDLRQTNINMRKAADEQIARL